ncbi:MAG: hypothetical protein A3B10_02940 [Candidatus Doudnabacteria bacterium RIFCSPLOWO2_01_FULL_44_21]|uniref:ROK family protein n=1 Tax=Candidatus Doudnabacteria bacterium RIFCSPLOWO2_01_FULL_44_21 TaxID=1817841 RepID=A0A1F5Q244_9BACT|nr:MAG: hypothetical protein A3B95_03205 [Candidatus Doudnabacteria bacterium RIFCSPHIGHO2_02_FULL_43_13b]OGE96243.1 MAG: hypothetical protein A3B10_02940 [Candidatus Doudnabacteria bacterium RIFCSPLOWO2_01_FULL_44_21]
MKQILGIDVGGTKIAAGLVDKSFRVSKIKVLRTSQTDLISQLRDLVLSYHNFDAIGIGVPGQVLSSGLVVHLPNIQHLKLVNLKQVFQKKFCVPVNVMNDAKAFALAEAILGSGKKFNIVVGVILGTGIGVGIVMNKKIYFGANSIAGEMGHFVIPNGKTFEQYVKRAGNFKNARYARKYLELLLYFITRSFDPEIIIVGGGWSRLKGMQQLFDELIRNNQRFQIKTLVKISQLKHAGIIGAVLPLFRK